MRWFIFIFICLLCACGNESNSSNEEKEIETENMIGNVERLNPALDQIVSADLKIEQLASGFSWAEGPVWLAEKNCLLFSDVPQNKIYKWTAEEGASLYLEPSGFTGDTTTSREQGSNGLTLDKEGNLVLCQHGDRRVAQFIGDLDNPTPSFKTIVDHFEGKRLNSPNDLVFDKQGNLYFTDPPYGLSEAMEDDPRKELAFQGVFQLTVDGTLNLITDEMSRPNGIALSPDQKTLYVANSDPERAIWMSFPIDDDRKVGKGSLFYDVTDHLRKDEGLPDGLKINQDGIIFATGPGGILIFNQEAELLGKIRPGSLVANCGFGATEKELYLTAHENLLRVKLK